MNQVNRDQETEIASREIERPLPERVRHSPGQNTHNNEFAYNGIFSAGGFLSQVEAEAAQDQDEDSTGVGHKKHKTEQVPFPVASENYLPLQNDFKIEGREEATINMVFNPNLPPNEAVVSINHILEKIFRYFQIPELLACRVVSRLFHSLAQKRLENLLLFSFSNENLVSTSKASYNAKLIGNRGKWLSNLTQELQTGLKSLPVVDYAFSGTPLRDPVLQEFFTNNGHNIQHLSIGYSSQARHGSYRPHENELMDQLRNLLLVQTPNIQSLELKLWCEESWIRMPRGRYAILREDDPELKTIIQSCNKQTRPLNTSLKSLQFPDSVNAKILETVIRVCPSLEKVELPRPTYDYNCGCIYLLSPQNRIHLLKSMEFKPEYMHRRDFKRMIHNLKTDSKSTLKLHDVNFIYSRTFLGSHSHGDKWLVKSVSVMNEILESSWDSLESVEWEGEDFPSGIKWPIVMPNVKHLSVKIEFAFESRMGQCYPQSTSFLSGLNWLEVFPRLESLELLLPKYCDDFENFFTWLNVQSALPKVKWVYLARVISKRMMTELDSFVRVSFPNARIKW